MSTTRREPRVTHYQVCATVLPFSMSTGKRKEVVNTGPLLSRPSDVILWSDTFQKCWNSRWFKPLCRVKSTLNFTVSITFLISTEGTLQRSASRQIVQFSSIGLTEQSVYRPATSVLEPCVFLAPLVVTLTSPNEASVSFTFTNKSSPVAVPFKPHKLTKSSPVAVPFKPHKLAAAHKHKRPHQCHQYLSSTVHVCDVITPTLRAHNNCMTLPAI
jgi:hypothetical protein